MNGGTAFLQDVTHLKVIRKKMKNSKVILSSECQKSELLKVGALNNITCMNAFCS